jgi:protein-S-isoprenylcysteine O-methyltransferase Ste14
MTSELNGVHWTDWVLLATYAAQIFQVGCYSAPSAGSSLEMLTRVRKNRASAAAHPSAAALGSPLKVAATLAATAGVVLAALLPAAVFFFPPLADALLPILPLQDERPAILGSLLLIAGNVVSFVGVATLRRHVAFTEFGETRSLCKSGIYRRIRNPISLGLGCIFFGFFFYLPTVAMLCGACLFVLNSLYRIRMEEAYLLQAFGESYVRYRRCTGMLLPKVKPPAGAEGAAD